MRKGEKLKTPHHASAAATRNDRLPHFRQYLNTKGVPNHQLEGCYIG